MIIKDIRITEGIFSRKIKFSSKANLIHSDSNSCGKTTLVRFMLYGLGYKIPSTKHIKFGKCQVRMTIFSEKSGEMILERNEPSILQTTQDGVRRTFVLPDNEDELHSLFFGTDDPEVLHNLLGSFYVDQEKGWTLLNRGVVIGSIRFSIEELVRGLSGIDCNGLLAREKALSRKISKYHLMSSVAAYREQLQQKEGSILSDSYEETMSASLDTLIVEQTQLKHELRRIDSILTDNRRFKRFVSELQLLVKSPDGNVFPVTQENIVGLDDSIQLLIAKRKITAQKLRQVNATIEQLNRERINESEQSELFKTVTQIESFDKSIFRMPLNAVAIKHEITNLTNQRKEVREQLASSTDIRNPVSMEMSETIIKYATELGIGDKSSMAPAYLYTSNLRELSGAVLHKMVFAFRMAYIKAVEDKLGIKLPIILDSPSGKEVDRENVALMMNILKRDFVGNQIIIASIYNHYFDEENIIEIRKPLINELNAFDE